MRLISLASASVAILMLVACSREKTPPPTYPASVKVAHPLQKQLVDWDEYVGRFEAIDSVDVRPRVTGYLQSIGFRDGQVVKKGQVLFVIDPRPYQAALDQAKGQEGHAAAAAQNAQVELSRAEKLLAAKAISEQEYQTRFAAQAQAAADLLAAKATVATAALNLSFTKVLAPLSGRISDRRVAPGNLVSQDTTVLTNIVNLDPIRFTFDGAEALYLKYQRENQAGERKSSRRYANPVEIRLQDQPNYAIKGRMDFVDNTLDANSGTIRGRAVVANPNYVLTPGMFGHLRLLGSGAYTGLLIPDTAIITQQSDEIVYVVGPDKKVQQRKITAGPLVDGLRAVRGGLKPDDFVIIDGLQKVRVGAKVNPEQEAIIAPNPGQSPTSADLAPPASSATFADPAR